MPNLYVLDAGVLFSTWPRENPIGQFLTTPGVIEEIQNRPSRQRVDTMRALDRIAVVQPKKDSIEAARAAASATGDTTVLSNTDIELIGLALEQKSNTDVIIVSTDFAVLNTARSMGIRIVDPAGRFKRAIIWALKCPACGHRQSEVKQDRECPVCGTEMRRVRAT